jgi:hypothetical protein
MGKVHEAIADVLAAELEGRPGWAEDPVLYRLHLRDRRPRLVAVDLGAWMDGLAMDPAEALELAATLMERGGFHAPADDQAGELHGMAFRHEGWGLLPTGGSFNGTEGFDLATAAGRLAMHDALEHRVYTRPDRIEVRIMVAVDRAGITYHAIQRRGDEQAERLIMFPGADPDEPHVTGLVVESLDRMVTQLTGVPAQRRPVVPTPEMN